MRKELNFRGGGTRIGAYEEPNPELKKLSTICVLSAGFVLVVCAGMGCKTTSGGEQPEVFTVVGVSGDARYCHGLSNPWYTVKKGDHIPQGSIVQTAEGSENAVGLVAGRRRVPAVPTNCRPYDDADKVIVYENTLLKINELTTRTVGGKKIWDTRLSLLTGAVVFDADLAWPTNDWFTFSTSPSQKVRTISPEPDKPYYEIRSSNIVIHAEHAVLFFNASGFTRVYTGAVALKVNDAGEIKDLFASEQYDPERGEIMAPGLDEWLHFSGSGGDQK